jgi:hypothetical protein
MMPVRKINNICLPTGLKAQEGPTLNDIPTPGKFLELSLILIAIQADTFDMGYNAHVA